MSGLDYANIGFRAESSVEELRKFRNTNSYDKSVIRDAYELMILCQKAWNADFETSGWEITACRKALRDGINLLVKNLPIEDIERYHGREVIINKTKLVTENLLKNKRNSKSEVELGIIFFDTLAERCKRLASLRPSCW